MSVDEVASALLAAIRSLNGPYAFLMVIPIGSFTHKEIDMVSNLKQVLGEEFTNHTKIMFSYSDNLESKSFDQFLMEEKGELRRIIECCGNRVYTWNNKIISTVCKLDQMMQDLKGTQRMNDNSKKCYLKTQISQQDHNLNTFDEAGVSDFRMKRQKRETPLDDPNEEVRVVVIGMTGEGNTLMILILLGQNFHIERSTPKVLRMVRFELVMVNDFCFGPLVPLDPVHYVIQMSQNKVRTILVGEKLPDLVFHLLCSLDKVPHRITDLVACPGCSLVVLFFSTLHRLAKCIPYNLMCQLQPFPHPNPILWE